MSYSGNHYDGTESRIKIFFNMTRDGKTWFPVNSTHPVMYLGGVSDVGFTFINGGMIAVMRNEDGDSSGFGSRIVRAKKDNLGLWNLFPTRNSDPNIYESPRMFSHNDNAYLIARKDLAPPFDKGYTFLPFMVQKIRAHTTALYRVDLNTNKLIEVMELPGCGDTAFPSIHQVSKNKFVVINYSSPL